ncbi:MAG: hypothetical protein LBF88_06310 [Planctomycetaceae bacterium]|jgi:hypothetical protein|nr:hypothetical protein [Planctomycetaceae bacterium]
MIGKTKLDYETLNVMCEYVRRIRQLGKCILPTELFDMLRFAFDMCYVNGSVSNKRLCILRDLSLRLFNLSSTRCSGVPLECVVDVLNDFVDGSLSDKVTFDDVWHEIEVRISWSSD